MNSTTRRALVGTLPFLLAACASEPRPPEAPPAPVVPPVVAAPAPVAVAGPSRFSKVVEVWVDARAALDPVWATRAGVHEHDGRLTRFDDGSRERRLALARRTLTLLDSWGYAHAGPGEQADVDLFRTMLAFEVHEAERHDVRRDTPSLALVTVSAVNDLLTRDFAPLSVRAELAVARLAELPAVISELQACLDRPPRLWTEQALKETEGSLEFLEQVPELTGPAPGLPEALAGARAALEGYADFLNDEVLPRSDGSYSAGREEFEWRLKHLYLLDLDADGLLALGREQFGRTLQLLDETAAQIDPARDWKALLAEMMGEHPTAEELLDSYRAEVAQARQYLIDHDIVGIPAETLQILETPAFLRTTTPFAAYDSPAPLDKSRLGTFYVTPDPEAHILSDIPGTTWHEAYPGHHLQLVYAKDNPSLVRRLNESPLLSEGWGFYCEELAHETGYYDDPRERLMQLNWRLQRAARVVLDASIHAFGMSYEDAVAFLRDEVGLSQGTAEASANAYTRSPAYYSSYMLGMLEIVRMREDCRARLGSRFSLREFHERLLRCGNVLPAQVEQALAEWR